MAPPPFPSTGPSQFPKRAIFRRCRLVAFWGVSQAKRVATSPAGCVCAVRVCVCVCQVAVSCSATFQHLAPPLPGVSRGEGRKLISAIFNFLATSSIHPSVPNTLKMVRIALPATTLPSIMDVSIEEVTEGHSQISPSATDYLDATPTAATTGPSATSAARVARSTTEGLRSAPSTAGSTSSTPGEMHLETLEAPPPVVVDAVEPASFGDVFRATTASQVSTVVRVHLGNELSTVVKLLLTLPSI